MVKLSMIKFVLLSFCNMIDIGKMFGFLKLLFKVSVATIGNLSYVVLDGFIIVYNSNLFGLYKEIFIQKCYDFKCDTDKPFIIDCGANIGISVLRFKKLYPNAKIVCFEPQEKAFCELNRNIFLNGLKDVKTFNVAVSDKCCNIPFFTDETGYSGHSGALQTYNTKSISVESVLLSEYIKENVDLLKVDVEGFEKFIIRDLYYSDKLDFVNCLILEYHLLTNDLVEIIEMLEMSGFKYAIYELDERRDTQETFIIKAWRV